MKNRLGSVIKIKSKLVLRDNAGRPRPRIREIFKPKKTAAYPVGLPDCLQTFIIALNQHYTYIQEVSCKSLEY